MRTYKFTIVHVMIAGRATNRAVVLHSLHLLSSSHPYFHLLSHKTRFPSPSAVTVTISVPPEISVRPLIKTTAIITGGTISHTTYKEEESAFSTL